MTNASRLRHGRVVIPAAFLAELDWRDGDQIVWTARDGELVAITRRAQLRRAQQRFQQSVAKTAPSLSQELIADRRRTAHAV
ncbi:AbrB/MazE/SpoVT family DNA-binding domain-containing protein [Pseudorhodoferax sp.]|uniref:AbrB/MazE/SpoVT family DNA-binding domain-containing protein n=1 Tax=Pseudorhodoferax sp. TaxID=1993553 RepID=UPI002DD63CE8|nr:AbrB/MazE/SpoVT family DNA-binding domain-containing protein [Pseudorhodoferax sp.]